MPSGFLRSLSAVRGGSMTSVRSAVQRSVLGAWVPVVAWAAVIALGILCTGVAFILYYRLIGDLGPVKALMVTLLIPVFGILWGVLLLDEPLTPGRIVGCAIVLVGCYYGYNASGGPVGVGTATAKSMVLNIVLVHLIGMLGTQLFWGANPRAPIGG